MKAFKKYIKEKQYNYDELKKMAIDSAVGFGGQAEEDQEDLLQDLEKEGLITIDGKVRDILGTKINYSLTKKGKEFHQSMKK